MTETCRACDYFSDEERQGGGPSGEAFRHAFAHLEADGLTRQTGRYRPGRDGEMLPVYEATPPEREG